MSGRLVQLPWSDRDSSQPSKQRVGPGVISDWEFFLDNEEWLNL